MYSWIDEKYVSLLSSQLRNFKRKKARLWNFSCPICNDNNPKKIRGYIYQKKGQLRFHCHNCSISHRFDIFLKTINRHLYSEYLKEKFGKDTQAPADVEEEKDDLVDLSLFSSLKSIDQLPVTHPARQYVTKRMIPGDWFNQLFYAPFFKKFVNSIKPNKFESIELDEPRLIIPFVSKDQMVIGFNGRSFDPDANVRYIHITMDYDSEKVFGLNRVDRTKKHFVVEGPIDAMLLPNAIACGGSSIRQLLNENSVAVFDNEPRNKDIVKLMQRTIGDGHNICIWPPILQGKDISDFVVKDGYSVNDIITIINQNIFSGLIAQMKFVEWKKV